MAAAADATPDAGRMRRILSMGSYPHTVHCSSPNPGTPTVLLPAATVAAGRDTEYICVGLEVCRPLERACHGNPLPSLPYLICRWKDATSLCQFLTLAAIDDLWLTQQSRYHKTPEHPSHQHYFFTMPRCLSNANKTLDPSF